MGSNKRQHPNEKTHPNANMPLAALAASEVDSGVTVGLLGPLFRPQGISGIHRARPMRWQEDREQRDARGDPATHHGARAP